MYREKAEEVRYPLVDLVKFLEGVYPHCHIWLVVDEDTYFWANRHWMSVLEFTQPWKELFSKR